ALWPFGRTVVPKPSAGVMSAIGNVIWFVVAGWWLALGHILTALTMFITIIGIPLAIANVKLVPVSLFPLGHEIVDADDVRGRRGRGGRGPGRGGRAPPPGGPRRSESRRSESGEPPGVMDG